MSWLSAPLATRGWGGRLPLEANGVGGGRLGGVGGIELEAGLKVPDALLQFSDPSVEGVQDGQDGSLGFRRHATPERFRDGRSRVHSVNTTRALYKLFDP